MKSLNGTEIAIVKSIRVWRSEKKEVRIYVKMDDGREGCRYLTGNPWYAPKSVDGNLTAEEWKEARAIGYSESNHCWNNFTYANHKFSNDQDESQVAAPVPANIHQMHIEEQ
jgi:hypothetical protein